MSCLPRCSLLGSSGTRLEAADVGQICPAKPGDEMKGRDKGRDFLYLLLFSNLTLGYAKVKLGLVVAS